MIPTHVKRTFLLSAAAFFLAVEFQNCAPMKSSSQSSRVGQDPNAPSIVHEIATSAVTQSSVSFPQPQLDIATQASVASVSAACDSTLTNATLEWNLLDPSGGPNILSGAAECINGQLKININPAQALACNIVYKLAVAIDSQTLQSINLQRFCP